MRERDLEVSIKQQPFFEEKYDSSLTDYNEGNRDMAPLLPFVISGGKNTERYYFQHINNITNYKLHVLPEYFGNESNYTEIFPKIIKNILEKNNDAKIYCVFDWDTIYNNENRINKHQDFENKIQVDIDRGNVVICKSMPSIEYWFLLHFEDNPDFLKDYREVSRVLAPHIKNCFSDPTIKLKKLLKSEKFLRDVNWVKNLCSDGKLTLAIQRAEANIRTPSIILCKR